VGVPLVDGHCLHVLPHCVTDSGTHWPLHAARPGGQVTPHSPFAQYGVPLGGVGHLVQLWPHAVTLSLTHAPPQSTKGEVQAMPHVPRSQTAVPLGSLGHTWPHPSQFALSESVSTHERPHWVSPSEQLVPHLPRSQTSVGPQRWPHAPQLSGSV